MPRVSPLFSLILFSCLLILTPASALAAGAPDGVATQLTRADAAPGCLLSAASAETACTLKKLPRQLLRDQEFLWLRPFRPERSDLPWLLFSVGGTAAWLPLDRPVAQELSDGPPGAGYAFSHRVGQLGGGVTDFSVAAAFYAVGRWRKDERARTTGLLGLRAVADSLIIVEILKSVSQRPRPTRDDGRQRNHNADGEFFTGGRSFPSGHAAGAWALATVVAHQYRHRRWVAPLGYGLATLVAVTRVTGRKHFPSDVFVGSVIGYLVGAHVSHLDCEATEDEARRWHLFPGATPGRGIALSLVVDF